MAVIIEITDFNAPELDVYARLTQAQLKNRRRPENGIFDVDPRVSVCDGEGGDRAVLLQIDRTVCKFTAHFNRE